MATIRAVNPVRLPAELALRLGAKLIPYAAGRPVPLMPGEPSLLMQTWDDGGGTKPMVWVWMYWPLLEGADER